LHPFTNPDKYITYEIPIDIYADNDYWEWTTTNKEKFSFKKTWGAIRTNKLVQIGMIACETK